MDSTFAAIISTLVLFSGFLLQTGTETAVPGLIQQLGLTTVWVAGGLIVGLISGGIVLATRINSLRSSSQTVEKNSYDRVVSDNEKLIEASKIARKEADRWRIVRPYLLETTEGQELLKKVEQIYDQVDDT